MKKHTPGPWRFDEDWHRIPAIFGPDDRQLIATVEKHKFLKGGFGVQKDLPEREANARLIAAAPDMLEALLWIETRMLGRLPDLNTQSSAEIEQYKRDYENVIRAAIALAMGNPVPPQDNGR